MARMGDKRGSCRVSAGRPEGKRPLGRPRRRWENNVKMNVQELEWGGGGGWAWTGLIWLRIGKGGWLL